MRKITLKDLTAQERQLVKIALKARKNAYAPYSKYLVGVAVLSEKGKIYAGCNVERVTFSQTTHAERNALDNLALNGERKIKILVCVCQDKSLPCAECRQAIWEFSGNNPNVKIIGLNLKGQGFEATIGELYPMPYGPEALNIDPERY